MRRFALTVVLVLTIAAPAAHAAGTATVTGKLTGAKLPAPGQGRVAVWALRLSDGVVVAGTSATAAGRFTLRTPPASNAILAAVIPSSGRSAPLLRVADFVTAKAGRRTVIKPTLKKRHKPKRRRARSASAGRAHAAWVNVDYPVVWVHSWTLQSGDPLLKVMEKGVQAMLITDLAGALGTPSCPAVISGGDDIPRVLAEIKLQQSKYFDPSTRLTTAHLIRPNASVTGTITNANGQTTLTATYKDQRPGHGGRGGTVSVTGAEDSIFDLEHQLVPKIVKLICPETPKTYAGSFSGSFTTQLNDYKVTWTGDAIIELTSEHGSPPPDGPAPSDYAHYVVKSGRVHATLDGTRGSCAAHGEASFDLATGISSGEDFVQAGVDRPWYFLNIAARGDEAIPYTETGSGCQSDAQYPLTGVQFAFTPKPLQSDDGLHLIANTSLDQFTYSRFTSSFTFAPAS